MAINSFQRRAYLPLAVLVCLESGLFLLAPYFATLIHLRIVGFTGIELLQGQILPRAVTFAVLASLSTTAVGLYSARRSRLPALLVRVAAAISVTAFLSTMIHDAQPQEVVEGETLSIAAFIAFAGAALLRISFDRLLDEGGAPRRVLVLGAGRRASSLAKLRRGSDRRGFEIAGYFPTGGDLPGTVPFELCIDAREDLLKYCREQRVEEIVIAMDEYRHGFPLQQINECRSGGIRIISKGVFIERETGRWRFDAIDPRWKMFSRWLTRRRQLRSLQRASEAVTVPRFKTE